MLNMKKAQRLALAVFAVAVITSASAKDIYIAQDGLGALNGLDAANAFSLAALNRWTNVVPGDTLHLIGVLTNTLRIGGSGTPGTPITLRFEPGAKFSAPTWKTPIISGAGTLNNIIIDGGGAGIMEATDNGNGKTYANGSSFTSAIDLWGGANIEIKNLVIRDLYLRTSNSSDCNISLFPGGIRLGGSLTNCSIHNCLITNVGNGIVAGANGVNSYCTNLQMYSNVCWHTSWGIGSYCNGSNSATWDTRIWANIINSDTNWDGCLGSLHSDGIASGVPSGSFPATNHHMRVYRNVFGPDVGAQTTAAMFMESGQRTFMNDRPLIFNNVIVQATRARSWGSGSMSMNANEGLIANNSFIFKNNTGTAMIINASGSDNGEYGPATNGVIAWTLYNNAMQGVTGVIGVGGGYNIANTAPLSVTNTDYNAVSSLDGNPQWWTGLYWRETTPGISGNSYRDFVHHPQVSRFDLHSINLTNVALFDASYAPLPGGNSLVGKGTNLTQRAIDLDTPELAQDFYGNPRPSVGPWTIGAVEGGGNNPFVTLTASSRNVTNGQTVTLSWSSANMTSLSLTDVGPVPLNGSTTFVPPASSTTVYTVTGSGPNGSGSSSVSVVSRVPAPTLLNVKPFPNN
jgi:hypothetical protein